MKLRRKIDCQFDKGISFLYAFYQVQCTCHWPWDDSSVTQGERYPLSVASQAHEHAVTLRTSLLPFPSANVRYRAFPLWRASERSEKYDSLWQSLNCAPLVVSVVFVAEKSSEVRRMSACGCAWWGVMCD